MNVSALDRPLEDRPEAFNGVRVAVATNVFFSLMIDCFVVVSKLRKALVGIQFVSRYLGARLDKLDNVRLKAHALHVRHDASNHFTAAFNNTEHNRLAQSRATALAGAMTTNHRFVGFDMARQWRVTVHNGEVLADFMACAPRGFVVHRKLALQFLGGHAVARRGEQVHRIEPLLQRHVRPMEWRSSHRVNVLTALAGICGHLRELFVFSGLAAAGAFVIRAKASFEQMLKAGVVVGEHLHELGDWHRLGHVTSPFLLGNLAWKNTYVNWPNAQLYPVSEAPLSVVNEQRIKVRLK